MASMCPSSETLVAFAEGSLSGAPKDAVAVHVEACGECLADVAAAVRALRGSARPASLLRRWALPLSAAAALLLAFVLLRGGRPGPAPGAVPVLPVSEAVAPFAVAVSQGPVCAEGGDRDLPLGRSALLTLKSGGRIELLPGAVRLSEGTLALDSRGDALRLRLPGGAELALEDAAVLASVQAPAGSAWLSEALAAEASGRIQVLRGTVRLRLGDREFPVQAGQETDLLGSEPRRAGPPAWLPGDWYALGGLPLRVKDAALALPGPREGEAFVWEALVRRAGPSTLFSVVWASGGKSWSLPLGQGALGEAGPWLRIRVESASGWVRIRVGDREVLRARAEDLPARAYPGERLQAYPGLSVRGGELEVSEGRWRAW